MIAPVGVSGDEPVLVRARRLSRAPRRLAAHRAATGTVALLVVVTLFIRLRVGGAGTARTVDDLAQGLAAAAMATAAGWRAVRERGRLRWSWSLIGAGGVSWAVGQSIWTYYEVCLDTETPFPSWADAGYLAFPLFVLGGLLLRPSHAFTGLGRLRVSLDVLLTIAALFTISWTTVLGEVYRVGGESTFTRIVSLSYPAGDVALVTVAVSLVTFARGQRRRGLLWLAAGAACFALADSSFAYLTASGTYQTGGITDFGWIGGFVILAWAAVLDDSAEVSGQRRTSVLSTVLPVVVCGAGIALTAWREATSSADAVLLPSAAVMIVVLLSRQALAVLDNGRLLERVQFHAFHDALTGVANRALFNDRLAHAVQARRRDGRPLALILIDLDGFKAVNDTLGHQAGDDLLVEVGRRLHAAVRAADTVARLGGDEFAIVLETTDDAADVADRALQSLSWPVELHGRTVAPRGSVGFVSMDGSDPDFSAGRLLRCADLAMYAAKRAGRNTVRAYRPEMEHGAVPDDAGNRHAAHRARVEAEQGASGAH